MPTNKVLRRRPADKPTIFLEGGLWCAASWALDYRHTGWGFTPRDAYNAWRQTTWNYLKTPQAR